MLEITPDNAININGTYCWDEGCTEDLNSANPAATRILVCNWSDRESLIIKIGGGWNPTDGIIYGPLPYPAFQNLYAVAIRDEGIPGPNGMTNDTVNGQQMAGYKWCRLRVRFGRLPWSPLALTKGELKISFSDELTAPATDKPMLRFVASQKEVPVGITPPVRVARADFMLTRYNLSGLPLSILNLKSCVNAATFDFAAASCSPFPPGLTNLIAGTPGIAGTTCPPGTLLFSNMETTQPMTLGGNNQITAVFQLMYRACGWNTVWNPDTAKFEAVETIPAKTGSAGPVAGANVHPSGAQPPGVSTTPGAQPIYPSADFAPLYGLL